MPYYSFVLLCYNNWELTNQAITTLNDSISDTYKQKGIEIIVVNNGSIDDTKKYLEQIKNTFSQQIELILIHLKENMGYSVGINTGLAQCKGEIITVLNNDLIFPKHWFDGIVNTLESDKSIGAAVPFLSHADMQQYKGVEFENLNEMHEFSKKIMVKNKDVRIFTERIISACVSMKKELLTLVGGNDFWFGLGHFDDDDWSLRVWISGYKIAITGASFVHHIGSATFKQKSNLILAAHYANVLKFTSKWGEKSADYGYRKEIVKQTEYSKNEMYFPLSYNEFNKPSSSSERNDTNKKRNIVLVADWMNMSSQWRKKCAEIKSLFEAGDDQLHLWIPKTYYSKKETEIVNLLVMKVLGSKSYINYVYDNVYPVDIIKFLCRYDVFLTAGNDYINHYFKYLLGNTSLLIK